MPVTSVQAQAQNQRELAKAISSINQVFAAAGIGGRDACFTIGIELTSIIKTTLSKPGTGRVYRIGSSPTRSDVAAGRGFRTHRASRPGQSPAPDTGRLRASYTYGVGQTGLGRHYVDVGTNVQYAPFLEFGTRFMAPRPHLRPSVLKYRAQVNRTIAAAILRREKQALARVSRGGSATLRALLRG